jgi:hypothetical protein
MKTAMAAPADNLFVKKASASNPGTITVMTIRENHSTRSIVNKVRESSSDSSTTAVRASAHLTGRLGIGGTLGCGVILLLGPKDFD